MPVLVSLAFALAGIHVGAHRVLPFGYAPAWSPNGARIAFVTRGDLWVTDADGTHQGRLARDADDPAWAPDGRRLVFGRGGYVWTVRADGLNEHRLGPGANPAWSPGGKRIAFDRGGLVVTVRWYGGDARVAAHGEDPRTRGTGGSPTFATERSSSAGNVSRRETSPPSRPTGSGSRG